MITDPTASPSRQDGSDAISMQGGSGSTDQPSFEQIDLGPPEHFPFYELQAGDLPFGLAVRPWLRESGGNGRLVPQQAAGEGRQKAAGGGFDSDVEIRSPSFSDHGLEARQQGPCFVKYRYLSLDHRHDDGFRLGQAVSPRPSSAGKGCAPKAPCLAIYPERSRRAGGASPIPQPLAGRR